MRHTIDHRLDVSWCAELSNGMKVFDEATEDNSISEWNKLKQYLSNHKDIKIERLHIFATKNSINETEFNGAITPKNASGYFFINRILASFVGSFSKKSYGFGHLDKDTIKIRWYTYSNGNLICERHEDRKVEDGTEVMGLIRNE